MRRGGILRGIPAEEWGDGGYILRLTEQILSFEGIECVASVIAVRGDDEAFGVWRLAACC